MPKVSVCIPTFNRKNFLQLTLESVYSQNFTDFEVVVLDDGSTDGTSDFIKSLNFTKLNYHYQQNSGDAAARNRLIDLAKGEYITFLDSDDLLIEGALGNMVNTIESYKENIIAYGGYLRIDENGRVYGRWKKKLYSGYVTRKLFQDVFMNSCGSIFPKTIFNDRSARFDISLKVCSDYALWLYLSTKYKFVALHEPTFKRRRHGENLSVASSQNRLCELKVLEDFYQKYGKNLVPENEARKRLSNEQYRVAKSFKAENNRKLAKEYYQKSFQNKWNIKSLLGIISSSF
jgi:glycosyltransferase involved in cell wall biosynthesis